MTKSDFPYLTPAMLEADGASIIAWVIKLWPEHSPAAEILRGMMRLVPLIEMIPAVREAIQAACNEINSITGAMPEA